MFKAMSLQARMILPILSCVLIVITVSTYIVAQRAQKVVEAEALARSEETAYRYSKLVQADLEVALDSARTLAHSFEGMKKLGNLNRDVANEMLRQVLERNTQFLGVWSGWEPNTFDGNDQSFVSAEGKAIPGHDSTGRFVPYWNRGSGSITVEPLVDYDKEGPGDYYQLPKKTLAEVITEPYEYPAGGKVYWITSLVVPIMSGNTFLGVAGIDMTLDHYQKVVTDISPYESSYAMIVSNAGKIVAHPDKTLVNKDFPYPDQISPLRQLTGKLEELKFLGVDAWKKTENYHILVPITAGATKTPWSFGVSVPKRSVLAGAREILWWQIAGALAAIVTLASIVLLIGSSINQPLIVTAKALRHASHQLTNKAQQVQKIGQNVAESSTEQASSVQETVASMSEISSMIRQTAEHTQESLKVARVINDKTNDGHRIMQQMSSSMEAIEQSNSQLQRMAQIINEISGKTKVINDIVFKTQLLSFNASIEAARAGEHGRGFSVVAGEVGNLAQISGKASNEIKQLLETSQKHVDDILKVTQKRVMEGQETSDKVLETFNAITNEVNLMTKQVQKIADATKEQEGGITQVTSALSQMDEATRSNNAYAKEALDAVREIMHSGSVMNSISKETQDLVFGSHVDKSAAKTKQEEKKKPLARETGNNKKAA